MTETMPPDPFLAGQTDELLAYFRRVRDEWAADPRMRPAFGTAEMIAATVGLEFPGDPEAPRVIASLIAALSSARRIVLERDGVVLQPGTLLTLMMVAAADLDDKAAGRG